MKFDSLPEGWSQTTLQEIIKVSSGQNLTKSSMSEGEIPVYGGNGVTGFHSDFNVTEETIVIGRVGFYCGSVHLTPKRAWVTDNALITSFSDENLCKTYLLWLLRHTDLRANDSGSAQPVISGSKIYPTQISFPPLAEQKVIADKLDTLLAQVDNTKARLDRIPEILKSFRQSVLAAAVSGKLTEEWRNENDVEESSQALLKRWLNERKLKFEDQQSVLVKQGKIKKAKTFKEPAAPDLDTSGRPTMPDSWTCVSVSEFAECLDNLRVPVKKDERQVSEGLYPYFGANGEVDRVDEFIFDGDLVMVTEDETFYGRVKPIAYRYTGKCWVNNHAHVLTAPTKEANDFLCFSLMYYKVIPWLSGTTGRAKLTQAALNSLPIALPPIKEQTEIVRRVEELFAFAERIEQAAQAAQSRVNNLTQSILAKAFRGELTADWRTANLELISGDNSAEALLARIKAERAKLSKKAKAKA